MPFQTIFTLTAGHNDEDIFGFYLTPGKRGPTINEGPNNRLICQDVLKNSPDLIIQPVVSNSIVDIDLQDRINAIDDVCDRYGKENVLSLAVHSNAEGDGKEWTDATGFTLIHYPGSKDGIAFCEILEDEMSKVCPYPSRGLVSRKNFGMTRGPDCAAVILEVGFHTNATDSEFIGSSQGRFLIAKAISASMRRWNIKKGYK